MMQLCLPQTCFVPLSYRLLFQTQNGTGCGIYRIESIPSVLIKCYPSLKIGAKCRQVKMGM